MFARDPFQPVRQTFLALRTRKSAFLEVMALFCIAFAYVFLATHFRASVLRQDWWWSLRFEDFVSYATDAMSGWTQGGIGAPVPYPTGYLAASAILVLAFVLGPPLAQCVYFFAIALFCTAGALLFAGRDADRFTRLGIAIFAVFNPWVYTETVAGHFYMILAYAGTMAMFGELLREGKRSLPLACCFLVIVQQIQFVIVPFGLFVYRFVRRGERLPLALATLLLLPACAGIALEYGRVVATPYLVAWEKSASLAPFDAMRLVGYFTKYGDRVRPVVDIAMDAAMIVALTGLLAVRARVHRAASLGFASLIAGATVYAMGTRGPIGSAFEWIVVSIPQSGLFREVYDLLAYTAMGYVLLASIAARKFVLARVAFLAVGCTLGVTWFFDSPSAYTVAAADIPRVEVDIPEHSRYALFPAFQPLSFDGHGSGIDPDAFTLPGERTPLNDFVPAFPEVAALAEYEQHCDASKLAALGVAAVVLRPWLKEQRRDRHDGTQCRAAPDERAVVPELGVAAMPKVGSLVNEIGAGNMFYADVPGFTGSPIEAVSGDRRYADPTLGWSDARIMFERYPDIAQAFGGVITSTASGELRIRSGIPVLANVRGRLVDQSGRTIVTASGGYRWLGIDGSTTALRCYGVCVIALQGQPPPNVPLNPPPNAVAGLTFYSYSPFSLRASVPPGAAALLRYDVSYSRYWFAFCRYGVLPHVRVDATTNGWDLPSRKAACDVIIINIVAALQCLIMSIAIACSFFVAMRGMRQLILLEQSTKL